MNSLVVLYRILRKFYGELKRIEKFFLYTYIIDMVIYSFLFVGSLILAGDFDIYFVLTPLIFFPIISGIIMFYGRTVYHGLAFLGVHMFPVAAGIANFYTQYFNCRDRDRANACQADLKFYTIGTTFLIALSILFQLLHTLYVYLIWKKGIWPLVYKFKNSRHDEIKEMHAIYEVQFPLFHAQVRDEKHYMMCIVYVGNVIQAILLYFDMRVYVGLFWHYQHGTRLVTYEPTPPEFKPGRKLVIRESSVPKYSHIV
ncbi:hypothetical protein RhiirA5_376679 [Rhizophagus irregularis]|uniref:Uncharacterized protein n=1 Tax=Rhizophagus irregularis TaxID=588596 RepID=A0A2N0PM30_9GLOM|nr:hypothetical protein RhiirA5_376679 [Rhizophagus irregularis]